MLRLHRLALPFAFLLLASLACSVDLGSATPTPTPSPVATLKDLGFEAPTDGSQLPFGPVEVKTYAWVDVGITQAELNINGIALRTDPVTNEKVNGAFVLTRITQLWTPPGPGTYTLAVRVQDTLGNWYTINTITVHIGDATAIPVDGPPTDNPAASATPGPSFTATATATLPRITFTPSSTGNTTNPALAASATNTSTATATVTVAAGAPFTTFSVDNTSLNAGQCTTLRWTSGNIQSIFLDNQPVTGAENRQVCPTAPTAYILRANSTSGEITKQVTIQVTGGAPFTTFSADSTTLNAGQCTLLHWTSGNITAIFLNNEGTVGTLDKQVCPTTTTLYRLRATTASSGDIIKEITITVSGSVANTATNTNTVPAPGGGPAAKPVLSGPVLSSPAFYNRSACGPTSLTITVTVSDATSVTLNFSIPGGVSGIAPMSTSNKTDWSYTLHVDDTLEIPTHPTGMLNFNFKAQGPGGTTSSITYDLIPLHDCP